MAKRRDTYRYSLWDGRKKVYIGITENPAGREQQHRAAGLRFAKIRIEGPPVSKSTDLDWEQQALEAYRQGHGGRNPRYNTQ